MLLSLDVCWIYNTPDLHQSNLIVLQFIAHNADLYFRFYSARGIVKKYAVDGLCMSSVEFKVEDL